MDMDYGEKEEERESVRQSESKMIKSIRIKIKWRTQKTKMKRIKGCYHQLISEP